MSDELIFDYIVGELEKSCPGPEGCHGCQNWCPKCGSVGHVCDDPGCDAHRRDTDVLRDMAYVTHIMVKAAEECRWLEKLLCGAAEDKTKDLTWQLRQAVSRYESGEKETSEIEGELREIRAPGSNLVPRKEGSKFRPRGR